MTQRRLEDLLDPLTYAYCPASDALRNAKDFSLLLNRVAEARELEEIHRSIISRANAVIRESLARGDEGDASFGVKRGDRGGTMIGRLAVCVAGLLLLVASGCKPTCKDACQHVVRLGGSEEECFKRCANPAFAQADIECVNDAKTVADVDRCRPDIKTDAQFLQNAYETAAKREEAREKAAAPLPDEPSHGGGTGP